MEEKSQYQLNDILEIIWMDAHAASGWTDEDQLQHLMDNENLLRMHTIGYFLYEDALYIFIAQTRDEKAVASRGSVMLVPKGTIQKIIKYKSNEVDLTVDAKVDE